jgi:integrase
MHFCSAAGIAPAEVTSETFEAFRRHIDEALLKDPVATYRNAVSSWNRAREAVAGWPDLAVPVTPRPRDWTLRWSAFPASLEGDTRAWLDRLGGQDLLVDLPFRPVRPSTLKQREWQIRAFASALVRTGTDPAALQTLADLVTVVRVKAGLRFFLERNGQRATSHTGNLAGMLKAIAHHHVGVDPAHLDQLRGIARKVDPGRRGLTETNRSRLRPLDDPDNVQALLHLPARLMELAQREQRPHQAALLAQWAVAIEILLMAPIRIGNLARLDVERHLLRPGKGGGLHLVIGPEEVKNREPLEYPLPAPSVALVERYLRDYRPVLAAGGTALFPGKGGAPKGRGALGDQISNAVRKHAGLIIHPHLFRHMVAKMFLDAVPGGHEVMRRVLGHRSIDTTTSFYTGLETAAAVRHFDKTILRLRGGSSR